MSSPANQQVRLRRALGLWDLILYGVIVIQPTAPMSVFGVLSNRGRGHVVTTILIAMVAMLLTAISYGRMARAYPSAGSAFTYVGQELNPALGYITGWSMVMDYMLNPIICVIWISRQAHVFAPGIPYWGWAVVIALLFTGLNIQGIRTSARINTALAAGMGPSGQPRNRRGCRSCTPVKTKGATKFSCRRVSRPSCAMSKSPTPR